jgi:hypothetical protein
MQLSDSKFWVKLLKFNNEKFYSIYITETMIKFAYKFK